MATNFAVLFKLFGMPWFEIPRTRTLSGIVTEAPRMCMGSIMMSVNYPCAMP